MRQMFTWSRLPAILCLLFVVGCYGMTLARSHQADIMERLTSPSDKAQVEAYVDLLQQRKFDVIEKGLDPDLVGDGTSGQLAQMAAQLPEQQPTSVKVVGLNRYRRDDLLTQTVTLEYEFPGRWLLANLTTQTKAQVQTITGFYVNAIPDSLEHDNRFTLADKGLDQYLVMLMALIDMGLTLLALVLCLRSGVNKRNWFWPIVCVFGVGRIAVNWTSGQTNFTPIWIGFPPAGAATTFYGPWTVYAAIPVGVILYMLLQARHDEPQAAS